MGAGKDTVADILERQHVFFRFAFADKLKQIGRELFPEEFKEGKKPRALLQELGQKMREIEKDCWANYLINKIEKSAFAKQNCVITDCRYLNELEIAKRHGFIPVRVVCADNVRLERLKARDGNFDPATFKHVSETELDGLEVVWTIDNSETVEELKLKIYQLMEELRCK
jgi:dephospho-CoA kinase